MITAAHLRACTSREAALALLRELGYPVQPVSIVAAEWRRAGIDIAWNGTTELQLAARTPQLDALSSPAATRLPDSAIGERFLRSLTSYNALVKPVASRRLRRRASRFTISPRAATLRRLDVDLAHPSAHALDRLNLLAAASDAARIFDRALDRESLTRQFFERFRARCAMSRGDRGEAVEPRSRATAGAAASSRGCSSSTSSSRRDG